jgi:hypothetical protein
MNAWCVKEEHNNCSDSIKDEYICSCPCHIKGEN